MRALNLPLNPRNSFFIQNQKNHRTFPSPPKYPLKSRNWGRKSVTLAFPTTTSVPSKIYGTDIFHPKFRSQKGTIRVAIEDAITWPTRKIVPILPGYYSDLELKPVGKLEVKLVQARDLTKKDLIGKCDPFAELYIRPVRSKMKKSRTIVHLELLYASIGTTNGFVNPFDRSYSMTSLENVLKKGAQEPAADGGEVMKKKDVIVRGVLTVTVISAEDLPPADLMGKADPYVVISLKKNEIKKQNQVLCR